LAVAAPRRGRKGYSRVLTVLTGYTWVLTGYSRGTHGYSHGFRRRLSPLPGSGRTTARRTRRRGFSSRRRSFSAEHKQNDKPVSRAHAGGCAAGSALVRSVCVFVCGRVRLARGRLRFARRFSVFVRGQAHTHTHTHAHTHTHKQPNPRPHTRRTSTHRSQVSDVMSTTAFPSALKTKRQNNRRCKQTKQPNAAAL
jgi:hypothetical protein